MTPPLPLHRWVRMECLCCALDADFNFKSASDLHICKACVRHQGSGRHQQREKDHRGLWRSELALLTEDRDRLSAQLAAAVVDRTTLLKAHRAELEHQREGFRMEFAGRMSADTRTWFESEAINAAVDQRDSAYRARDAAMRVIWGVAQNHEADGADRCSCGKSELSCPDFNAIADEIAYLNQWEHSQIKRAEQDQPHGLPRDHPKYRKWRI